MKKILITSLILTAAMLLLPLVRLEGTDKVLPTTAITQSDTLKYEPTIVETFKVYDPETEKITLMPCDEYIFGVVAAEMPALYHEEALKAQAVAAYTFACSRKNTNEGKEYDITSSPLTDQSFISKEEATQRWGEKAAEYTQKIESAIKETKGCVLTYKGKLITAVYHAISSGKTESCKNVWGKDLPYLVSVPSEDDRLAENYISSATFTKEELTEKLSSVIGDTQTITFGEPSRTESGNVKEITVCGKVCSGAEIRELLELRSSNFAVTAEGDKITFTVYGYGHGVGMSQNGANAMAKKGSDFKEILTHYYTGCEIEKLN